METESIFKQAQAALQKLTSSIEGSKRMLDSLVNILQAGQRVDSDLIQGSCVSLHQLDQLQSDCITAIDKLGCTGWKTWQEAKQKLDEIEKSQENDHEIRELLFRFASLSSEVEDVRATLVKYVEKAKTIAESVSGAELFREAAPYSTFINYVGRQLSLQSDEDKAAIIQLQECFDGNLVLGLMMGQVYFSASSCLKNAEVQGEEEKLSISVKPKDNPVPGELFMVWKKKEHFSTKAFANDMRSGSRLPYEIIAATAALHLMKQEHYLGLLFKPSQIDLNRAEVGNLLQKLYNKGYLSYFEDSLINTRYYALSPLGQAALATKSSRELVARLTDQRFPRTEGTPIENEIEAVRAMRYGWCMDAAIMIQHMIDEHKGISLAFTAADVVGAHLQCDVYGPNWRQARSIRILALPMEQVVETASVCLSEKYGEIILYVSDEENPELWEVLSGEENAYLGIVHSDGTIHTDRPLPILEESKLVAEEEAGDSKKVEPAFTTGPNDKSDVSAEQNDRQPKLELEEMAIQVAAEKETERPQPHPDEEQESKKTMTPDEVEKIMLPVREMLAGTRPDCALLYLRAERLDQSPELALFYQRLAFISGDPLSGDSQTPEVYSALFSHDNILPGDEELYSYLAAAGMLRLFVWPGSNDCYQSWVIQQFQEDKLNSVFQAIPDLHIAFRLWAEFIETTRRGFDERMIQRLRQRSVQERQHTACCKAASDGIDIANHFTHGAFNHKKSERLVQAFFGPSSDLQEMLKWAAEDQRDCIDFAKEYCDGFLKNTAAREAPFQTDDIDQNKVCEAMDKAWSNLEGTGTRKANDPFKGDYRTSAMKKASDLLLRVANWAYLDSAGEFDDTMAQQMTKKLVSKLRGALEKLTPIDSAGKKCLAATLDYWIRRLVDTGEEWQSPRKYFYVDMLRSCHVELDEDYLPIISGEQECNLANQSLACRTLAHWAYVKELGDCWSWEDRLKQILMPESVEGDDYGCAELICGYLTDAGIETRRSIGDYYEDIKKNHTNVADLLKERLERFTGEVEMAQNYGQLAGERKSEEILRAVNLRSEQSKKNGNYGFLFRMMAAYITQIQEEAKHRAPTMEAQYKELLRSKHGEEAEWPILADVRKMIDEHKYSIAEEYIGQIKMGQRRLPSRNSAEGKDYLREFLAQYEKTFSACSSLRTTLVQILDQRQRSMPDTRDKKSARELAVSWPNGGILELDKVRAFLKQLSLVADSVNYDGESRTRAVVRLEKFPSGISDYAHPVAAFGSLAVEQGVKIIALFGQQPEQEILEVVRKASGSQSTIVLLDCAVPIQTRRKLAQAMKKLSTTRQKVFLLLDRVLLLYLTSLPQSERLQAMLQCCLPFSYCQPYQGTGHIPPEMFVGRREELAEIRAFGGPNLVYGGRQLGKTELLRRAVSLDHDPEQNSYAVYLSIKQMDTDQTLAFVSAELCRMGILNGRSASWRALCDGIRSFVEETTPRRQFRLLLDEADEFLESCREIRQHPIELLRDLQERRLNTFKFVLAGLRDVVRFDQSLRSGNSPYGHLRSRIIKPLSYSDALELLEGPLYYLGFRIEGEQRQLIPLILSRTNYYPGLIQFYCTRLVTSLADSYEISGYDVKNTPPYMLNDNHIKAILRNPDFLREIQNKLFITLESKEDEEDLYSILAYALAYLYYNGHSEEGYSAQEIHKICQDFDIQKIVCMPVQGVETLLLEMEELNVLRSADRGTSHYLFNRHSFFQMMGSEENVFDKLDEYSKVKEI